MNAQEVAEARLKAEMDRLEKDFTYHPPKPGQTVRYEAIRAQAKQYARFILDNTIPSREQSTALTKLDEVVFWANAAIARNE